MKVVFFSAMFSDVEADIKLSKKSNPVSGHKFQENLIKGLYENDCDMSIINVPRVRTYPNYPKIMIRKKHRMWNDTIPATDVGIINLPLLSYLTSWVGCYRALRKELKKSKKEPCILATFNSNLHTCLPMLVTKALHKNLILCNVVGDLHGSYGLHNRIPGFKGFMIRVVERLQDPVGKKLDCFVFLTKYMAQAMGVAHKPNCIVEGLYNVTASQDVEASPEDEGEKIIFYAGTMCKEYGIDHLLRSFSLIEDESYRLWLAGGGDTEPMIREYAQKDPRIQYFGYITPQEVAQRQNRATALISPRTSELDFVKYSFASKTMECLASGKPYIAHKLPCDPPEYAQHIQYAADDSDEALRDQIMAVCALPYEKRKQIGQDAMNFIATQKNPRTMCRRIVDLWQSILDSRYEKKKNT